MRKAKSKATKSKAKSTKGLSQLRIVERTFSLQVTKSLALNVNVIFVEETALYDDSFVEVLAPHLRNKAIRMIDAEIEKFLGGEIEDQSVIKA